MGGIKSQPLFRRRLSHDEGPARESLAVDYGRLIRRTAARAAQIERDAERSPGRVSQRFLELVDAPWGRRWTALRNAPPGLLATLARSLIEQSYEARFEAPGRSLRLARLALGCAEAVADADAPGSSREVADLHAEALAHLGNALRLNSDLRGAEEALANAVELLRWGTGQPKLHADLASLVASLRFAQGRPDAAAALLDREIAIRWQLGDDERLGFALIDRGIVSAWLEPMADACDHLAEGVARVESPERILLALSPLAERLARDGDAEPAEKVLAVAEQVASVVPGGAHRLRLEWIRAISRRAAGDLEGATRLLSGVRERLLATGATYRAALAALDLAAVHAAARRNAEAGTLAQEAYLLFRRAGVERKALAAVLLFSRAARRQQATEAMGVRVANLLSRRGLDRRTTRGIGRR